MPDALALRDQLTRTLREQGARMHETPKVKRPMAVATLTIHGLPRMTLEDRTNVLCWFTDKVNWLAGMDEAAAKQYAQRFTARYYPTSRAEHKRALGK